MTRQRMVQWLLLAATAVLMMLLKWLHLGVTHYNIFLLILIGWTFGVIIAFRTLAAGPRDYD